MYIILLYPKSLYILLYDYYPIFLKISKNVKTNKWRKNIEIQKLEKGSGKEHLLLKFLKTVLSCILSPFFVAGPGLWSEFCLEG